MGLFCKVQKRKTNFEKFLFSEAKNFWSLCCRTGVIITMMIQNYQMLKNFLT